MFSLFKDTYLQTTCRCVALLTIIIVFKIISVSYFVSNLLIYFIIIIISLSINLLLINLG